MTLSTQLRPRRSLLRSTCSDEHDDAALSRVHNLQPLPIFATIQSLVNSTATLRPDVSSSSPISRSSKFRSLTCSPLLALASKLTSRRPRRPAAMEIIRMLLLLLVAISCAAARDFAADPELSGASTDFLGDSGTAGSPNARLRGAVGVPLLESDSSGAGGEEGRFEAGVPEFLEKSAFCKRDGGNCKFNFECCGSRKCSKKNKKCYTPTPAPTPAPMCKSQASRCYSDDECCELSCVSANSPSDPTAKQCMH